MTTLIVSIVFLFLGFGLMVWSRMEFDRCTRMLEDCKGILERDKEMLDARKRLIDDIMQRLISVDKQLDDALEEHSGLCAAAGRTDEVEYRIVSEQPNCFAVGKRVAVSSNGKDRFPEVYIKRFHAESGSPEDIDFARREAEELLDKLNEK